MSGTKRVEDKRENDVLRVVCLYFISLFFLLYHTFCTLTFDVLCVKVKVACV